MNAADRPPASRSRWLLTVVWLGGAALATAIGLLAVNVVSTQVGDPGVAPLNAGQIQVSLSASPTPLASSAESAPAAPTTASALPAPTPAAGSARATTPSPATAAANPTAQPAPTRAPQQPAAAPPASAPSRTRTFRNAGGTIAVRCMGSTPQLLYEIPADGYAVSRRETEGAEVDVRFEGGDGDGKDPRLRVSCASGVPQGRDG